MSAKSDLKHSIMQLLKHNKDGSYKTQADRKQRLLFVAEQLIAGGYKIRHIKQLKLKHVRYLVGHWLQQPLSPGTIKNRMTDLRWALAKFDQEDVIPKNNDALGIPKRCYVTQQDKSIVITEADLSKIIDPHVKMSLILQREFGLRREESIKIRINQAVVGDELHLKGSWCKNGRSRIIKIREPNQWRVIQQVKDFVGNSQRALIPANKKYVQQENIYDHQLKRAGIHKAHGLRHAYAQQRYYDLTGWQCPVKGGPLKAKLDEQQLYLDYVARGIVSEELGHERIDVINQYIGT